MPAERLSMRKIRDVLRLTHGLGMPRRLVGEAMGIGKTAVGEYVRRAAVAGLGWPIPDEIDDAELGRLHDPAETAGGAAKLRQSAGQAALWQRAVLRTIVAIQQVGAPRAAQSGRRWFVAPRRRIRNW
jgi:hypothetical protein